ncbi:MAG: pyruvate kinase [Hyphomicrobiaceae bacterium]
MKRNRYAKIVATLGPASSTPDSIRALFLAGVDVFRLNFSHGTQEDHRARHKVIRDLEDEFGRPIGILADLQGPKLRIGAFRSGAVDLARGQAFDLVLGDGIEGNETEVGLPHPEIFAAIKAGEDLLVNDGRIRLHVVANDGARLKTEVAAGGRISDRKGVNVPGTILPIEILTAKDRADMEAALDMGVEWIALSFVQRPEDVREARALIGARARVLSKLEKPSAIDNLDAIVRLSDAIMVARGDLGVELPPEVVPKLQKQIIATCRLQGKPVIVATQMLESMVHEPVPTRAEASDVATAIYGGADAVMLSAESAAGAYPVEAVAVMSRIIETTESDPDYERILHALVTPVQADDSDAIAAAASAVAVNRGCAAISTFTESGATALRVARLRTIVPLLGLTPNRQTARQLALVWGVHSVKTRDDITGFIDMVGKSTRIARREGLAGNGDRVVITAGVPFGKAGTTNILRIAVVGEHERSSADASMGDT